MVTNDNIDRGISKSNYLSARSNKAETLEGFRRDSSWVRASFIAPHIEDGESKVLAMDKVDIFNMGFSSAYFNYYDTAPGGSAAVNPVPSFTSFADIRVKGLASGSRKYESIEYDPRPIGPGRFHSETFNDNMQVVHFRFGVPAYNSLTQFFTGFYNSSASSLARTGRYETSWIEKFLKFASGLISLVLMPLAIIPIAFIFIGQAVRFLLRIPSSSFYYLKPSMPAYWQAVTSMYNQLGVNMGMIKYTQQDINEAFIGQSYEFNGESHSILHQIFPDYTDKGVIDVCGIAGRYKRMEAQHRKKMLEQLASDEPEGWYGKVKRVYENDGMGLQQLNPQEALPRNNMSPANRLWKWWNDAKFISIIGGSEKQDSMIEKDLRHSPEILPGMSVTEADRMLKSPWVGEEKQSIIDYFIAEADDGSAYASFRVNNTGAVSTSFSNSTAENSMKQKFNSASSSARDLRINLAGGNIDPWGIAQTVLSGVGTILSTVADTLQVSGLAAFAGNAFMNIPDHWESSSSDINSMSYTIDLVSPYNNKVSQMLNIYLPLCMLLAGALPLATGKQSHQSPFLCQVFDRGRCISRLAIIESLSIERGTGHTAWTKEGNALGVKVNVRLKDLSSIVAMPIQNGVSLFPLEGIFDGENNFTDLLMSWSGLSLRDVMDRGPTLRRQIDTKIANYSSYFSASRLAMDLGDSSLANLASIFMSGTNKK